MPPCSLPCGAGTTLGRGFTRAEGVRLTARRGSLVLASSRSDGARADRLIASRRPPIALISTRIGPARPCGVMKPILFPALLLISTAAFAHSGGLHGQGGHNGRAAGTYHFHQGLLAGETFATKEQATTALQVEVAPARQLNFQGPNWRLSLLARYAWLPSTIRIYSTGSRDDTLRQNMAGCVEVSTFLASIT